ncbi:MAG: PEP-CTERM sorting domain-containing protein [Pirellulaceae bacterium]|nr:PEP-CTERM sorting domain-containing protein [Pirellulaceae bacterium]
MKTFLRPLCGLAALAMIFVLSTAKLSADFSLSIDTGSLRLLDGVYEVDTFITSRPAATTVQMLLLNLQIMPPPGEPNNSIDGVQFVGLRNPDVDPLFASPSIISEPNNIVMRGSLFNPNRVNAPTNPTLAFTIQFRSIRSGETDVRIGFGSDNYFMRDLELEGITHEYAQLNASGEITVTGVPEPGSCLLLGLALTGVAFRNQGLRRVLCRRHLCRRHRRAI